ncbi:MAG: fumarylacetoacetase [Planctomycetota bacterium]
MDATHQPELQSWIESANHPESEFPIQNLPYGLFTRDGQAAVAVAIGDQCFFPGFALEALASKATLDQPTRLALQAPSLHPLMNLRKSQRVDLRRALSQLLQADASELRDDDAARAASLRDQTQCEAQLPLHITDYTDFYASVFHATNVGSMFRPDNPLLPNYKWIPIGYHGRASSVVCDGTPVRRPLGQLAPSEEGGAPTVAACRLLDYELEVGIWVAEENALGEPISMETAEQRLFGLSLLNDWSARDLQKWEYQPLGPFLAKSFATTVAPWIVTAEALEPFRAPAFERPTEDPQPLPHLDTPHNRERGGVDLTLEVYLASAEMRAQGLAAMRLSQGSFRDLYWTPAQMITHHASNGCPLRPGDLLGSGTVSGRARDSRGCLLELTWDGELGHPVPGTQRTPLELPTGEQRRFLQDGDEVTLRGFCEREGAHRIGFGSCRGTILEALA